MKIAVCIKRVPVMEVKFSITADGTRIDDSGLKYDVNDFDLWAVEAALQLKEKNGNSPEVTVITLGPDAAQEQLRKALAMGADKAVLLKSDNPPSEGLAVAGILADELRAGSYDVIFLGRVAIDSANQTMGPMLSELLGLPCVTNVSGLDMKADGGTAHRTLEGAVEVVQFPLPVILTVDQGLNNERLPSLKGIMAAKKKPLETKAAAAADSRVTVRKMSLPPERTAGRIVGEGAAAVPELVRLLQTEAKVL